MACLALLAIKHFPHVTFKVIYKVAFSKINSTFRYTEKDKTSDLMD